jgi:hypothetical protein
MASRNGSRGFAVPLAGAREGPGCLAIPVILRQASEKRSGATIGA